MHLQRSLLRLLAAWITLAALFPGAARAQQDIDVDMSACNQKITYSQMLLILKSPEQYDGKLFRARGKFNYSQVRQLPRIIFSDPSGCCEVALEVEPAQPLRFPEDYPPLWGDMMITARLVLNPEGSASPCHFAEAVIEWEK
jgi:hypothetical protein